MRAARRLGARRSPRVGAFGPSTPAPDGAPRAARDLAAQNTGPRAKSTHRTRTALPAGRPIIRPAARRPRGWSESGAGRFAPATQLVDGPACAALAVPCPGEWAARKEPTPTACRARRRGRSGQRDGLPACVSADAQALRGALPASPPPQPPPSRAAALVKDASERLPFFALFWHCADSLRVGGYCCCNIGTGMVIRVYRRQPCAVCCPYVALTR